MSRRFRIATRADHLDSIKACKGELGLCLFVSVHNFCKSDDNASITTTTSIQNRECCFRFCDHDYNEDADFQRYTANCCYPQ